MKVYLVWSGEYENATIATVHSTIEGARAAVDRLVAEAIDQYAVQGHYASVVDLGWPQDDDGAPRLRVLARSRTPGGYVVEDTWWIAEREVQP